MDIQTLKKNQSSVKAQIRRDVVSVLSGKGSVTKKELFSRLFDLSPLFPDAKADTDVDSIGVLYRSIIGAVLNDSIEMGEITLEGNVYTLNRDVPLYIRGYEVKEYVKTILKENVPYSKKEIFKRCEKAFGTDKTNSNKDDNRLRAFVGEFLTSCERNGTVTVTDGAYFLSKDVERAVDSYDSFINTLNSRGGENFEQYGAMLLRAFYEKSGVTVDQCNVTGGSDDGGVDIVVRTTDKLGFKEFICVQAKARRNNHVTLKEVREFIGAMHTQGGSKGIYLTTSVFHSDAKKLIEEVPNVTAIDGATLYSLAKECEMLNI